jgi:hypothetical protein
VFWFFLQIFFWNISHSKKNWARNNKKFILVFMLITRYSRPILMKSVFSRNILEKCTKYQILYNPSTGSQIVSCGQTDGLTNRHDEGNSSFSQICECVKNCCVAIYPNIHFYTDVEASRYVHGCKWKFRNTYILSHRTLCQAKYVRQYHERKSVKNSLDFG